MSQNNKKQSRNKKGGVSVGTPQIAAQRTVKTEAELAAPAAEVKPAAAPAPVKATPAKAAHEEAKKPFPLRAVLIAAAVVIACFIVVMVIVLVVPRNSGPQEIDSIAAYNDDHGTDYLYPDPDNNPNTSDLYTEMHTYVYSEGWSDKLLHVSYYYAGIRCDLYVQLDPAEDLAAREEYNFLNNFNERPRQMNFQGFSITYREQGDQYWGCTTTDDAVYYLHVAEADYAFTMWGAIITDHQGQNQI